MKHPKIIQKFGDRKGPDRYSVSDMAHTIPANPMSDRGQLLVEPCILRPVRTELAKELRRQGVERFANRQMQPRTDGISNTLTSVEKDNYLYEPITCASRKRGDVHKLGTGSVIANCLTSIDTDSMVAETLISVHPLSHALEFNGDKSFKEILPTLRATDYKCPNVVLTKQKSDMRKEVEKTDEELKDMAQQSGSCDTDTTIRKDNMIVDTPPELGGGASIKGDISSPEQDYTSTQQRDFFVEGFQG